MDKRKTLGDCGEKVVADCLTARGFRILARQWRCRWGEIDIIARTPQGIVCFVEVKTRAGPDNAWIREAVTPAKQRRIRNAASVYLAQENLDCPCRFDVAEIFHADTRPRLRYITGAF